jgi:hypothetical protein
MQSGHLGRQNRIRAKNILNSGESLIDYQFNFDAGTIGKSKGPVRDVCDLILAKKAVGGYILIVHMKLQFFFEDNKQSKWTIVEKSKFVFNWQYAVKTTWGNRIIRKTVAGSRIGIDFRFTTRIGGWMMDHWEISVRKIPKGGFRQSSVFPIRGNVLLDSEDIVMTPKRPNVSQRGVIHEFGHMIGLEDEYSHRFAMDYKSVMNSGEAIRKRHDAEYILWLNKKLKEHGIK